MTVGRVLLLAVIFIAAGCAVVPPEWTWNEYEYKCGSDIAYVENVTGRRVQRLETVRGPYTHVIREEDAVVWLGFEDGKLRYYQTTWPVNGRMASMHRGHDICENQPVADIPVPRRR